MGKLSIIKEFGGFLIAEKKWWLLPIVIILLILGGIVMLAQTYPTLSPFIYALF